jgi:hypothetical protein
MYNVLRGWGNRWLTHHTAAKHSTRNSRMLKIDTPSVKFFSILFFFEVALILCYAFGANYHEDSALAIGERFCRVLQNERILLHLRGCSIRACLLILKPALLEVL